MYIVQAPWQRLYSSDRFETLFDTNRTFKTYQFCAGILCSVRCFPIRFSTEISLQVPKKPSEGHRFSYWTLDGTRWGTITEENLSWLLRDHRRRNTGLYVRLPARRTTLNLRPETNQKGLDQSPVMWNNGSVKVQT